MKNISFIAALAIIFHFCPGLKAQVPQYSIQQYLSIRSASGPSFSPDGSRIAYLSNTSGTSQVWTMELASQKAAQLTKYDDNVSFVRWLGDGKGIIFGMAKGGNENTQFYWMKTDGTGVKQLTSDPAVRHNLGVVADDGSYILYASNKRDRNYFDIYSMALPSGVETLIYQNNGNNSVAAANDSGSKLIISRSQGSESLDNDLYLIDARTKTEQHLTPHIGPAQFGNVNFVADGIVLAHNDGREYYSLAMMRKRNAAGDDWTQKNRELTVVDDTPWDVTGVEMSHYGSMIAYVLNREGYSELRLRKYETGGKPLITTVDKAALSIDLPSRGIAGGMTLSTDQKKLAFTFSSPRHNSEIWVYDLTSHGLQKVTKSDLAGVDIYGFSAPELVRYKSFDDREITAWFYAPQKSLSVTLQPGGSGGVTVRDKVPVIVSVHGGPESQERPGFNPLYQYYLSRGYAILAPNVRGSTGFGKAFTHLDDVRKREDSVRDIAYAAKWLAESGHADPKRIAIMGGSYGGYMTLAAITLFPELWAAAVDTVGIANWESFLKNTSGYRRRQREVEYGRLDHDLSFLRSISPLARVDKVKTPLFVIHGKNDPRVPYTEAEQIVEAIRKQGGTVEYKLYDDEGHGISKLKNRLELYPLVADFLDANMKK